MDKSRMFDLYPQPDDYIPNNRPRPRKEHKLTIMTGEDAIHTFEVPFDVEKDCITVSVIYKLGLDVVVVKYKSSLDIHVYDDDWPHSSITVKLDRNETELFFKTCRSAKVQLKFVMADGSIQFSEIYPIKLEDSLANNSEHPVPPIPIVNAGFG